VGGTENSWVARAASLAEEVLARHAEDVDRRGRWPEESIAALRESRLLGLTVPASFGGIGEGPGAFTAVTRHLAGQCASTAMIYLMHGCATQVVAAAQGFPVREQLLGEIAAGRRLGTLAFSEKGSRSHFWAPVSQVVREGNAHWLSADKSFVTSAGHADFYIVSTRSPTAVKATDSVLYCVRSDAPGLGILEPWNGLGLRGNASAPLRLEKLKVSSTEQMCADGEGFGLMMDAVLPWFQVGNSAVSLGIARAATEGIRRHLLATKLEHLGQSLASLPTLRARLAQMQIAVDAQEALLAHVAAEMTRPGPNTMLGLLECKAAAAEAALQVTDQAMRIGAGAAFSRHLTVERNFRDARASSIMAPTTDVLLDFIGRILLDMPLL
jgi:alkylation response protein AidB-like acyl-CoA dehydrogenase